MANNTDKDPMAKRRMLGIEATLLYFVSVCQIFEQECLDILSSSMAFFSKTCLNMSKKNLVNFDAWKE